MHQWPWRRGTVVLPDGDYEFAVLSPAASIRPYRGKGAFKGGVRMSNCVIKQSGRTEEKSVLTSAASGDYKLLYAPVAMAMVPIEPRSGLPRASR